MLQDAVQQEEWSQPDESPEEIAYVPDVFCPNCKAVIRVPRETYAWYDGAPSSMGHVPASGVRVRHPDNVVQAAVG